MAKSKSKARTAKKETPLMKQYWEIKSGHPDKILFFRMGDFFELFHDDAVTAAPLVGIALTSRNKSGGDTTPMCGVPHHSIATPINTLLSLGYKVAICDQLEDPKSAKGIVKRGVTRMLSPGMVFDPDTLDGGKPNYLCAFDEKKIAFLESTTGEAFYFETESLKERKSIFASLNPVEVILSSESQKKYLDEIRRNSLFTSVHEGTSMNEDSTLGRLLDYAVSMQGEDIKEVFRNFERREHLSRMLLPESTIRHLEVFETYKKESKGSLYHAINCTKTSSGARLLRYWLQFPLRDEKLIRRRQIKVAQWKKDIKKTKRVRDLLTGIGDIERRVGRLSSPNNHPRDMLSLAESLARGLDFEMEFSGHTEIGDQDITNLIQRIFSTIKSDLPKQVKDQSIINKGVDSTLDEYLGLAENGQKKILEMEAREKEKLGIPSLKIRYNNVFGYYIEVTNTHKDKVPDYYLRKQTLVNAERYLTDELQELERKLLSAKQKRADLEKAIYEALREDILKMTPRLSEKAQVWAEMDVILSLAWLSVEYNYCQPEISTDGILKLSLCRHPVVEQTMETQFVPNDFLSDSDQLSLITGPNMAGKSTLMRQVALISLMAQIGSDVPARSAHLPLFDSIFTRIGASDSLSEGLSTFMVEMTETSEILRSASGESLIVFDEIGRGTSTYDGMSLAQALMEYLINTVGATILFATHYHELTELESKLKQIKNFHMGIEENEGNIDFLYTLEEGPANRSYGVEVGRLAGLPTKLVDRAKEILSQREKSDDVTPKKGMQLDMFSGLVSGERPA